MRVAVYADGEYESLGNFNLPPADAARRYVEENGCDFSESPVQVVVTPIDDEAQALPGWQSDEEEPAFMLFEITCRLTWEAKRSIRATGRNRANAMGTREAELKKSAPPWGLPRSYACDDHDPEDQRKLVIFPANDGDWYVSVIPVAHRAGPAVRLCTSGGASSKVPGLTNAIADAYRALGGERRDEQEGLDELTAQMVAFQVAMDAGPGEDVAEVVERGIREYVRRKKEG